MKKAALLLIALCPIATFAQSAKPSNPPAIKLIRLHYVEPIDILKLISGSVVVASDDALKAVVIRGNPEAVAKAERMIQELDVPQPQKPAARNVELTVYVIGATNKAAPQAAAMPENLQPVVRQLKAVFPYSNYSLLDSMLLRSRDGKSVDTSGMLRDFPAQAAQAGLPNIYDIDYHLKLDTSAATRTIHFLHFSFRAHERTSHTVVNAGFKTNLDLPEGKKVVVGKTNIDGGDAALFVVLSAKIE